MKHFIKILLIIATFVVPIFATCQPDSSQVTIVSEPKSDTVAIIYVLRSTNNHVQRDVVRAYTQMSIEELFSLIGDFFYITMHPEEDELVSPNKRGEYTKQSW